MENSSNGYTISNIYKLNPEKEFRKNKYIINKSSSHKKIHEDFFKKKLNKEMLRDGMSLRSYSKDKMIEIPKKLYSSLNFKKMNSKKRISEKNSEIDEVVYSPNSMNKIWKRNIDIYTDIKRIEFNKRKEKVQAFLKPEHITRCDLKEKDIQKNKYSLLNKNKISEFKTVNLNSNRVKIIKEFNCKINSIKFIICQG